METSVLQKRVWYIFFSLVLASLLTPFWVFKELLFPFITSKAFFFRITVEAALPFYLYLILTDSKLRPRLKNPLNIAAMAFLVINIVSALMGVNPARSLWGNFERMGGVWYLAHLSLWFFYIQAIGQAGDIYLKRFMQAFVAVGTVLSVNGFLAWVGGPTLTLDPSAPFRVSSTFGNPIFLASFLIIPMFLAVYLALQEKDKAAKITYWIAAALQMLGIYLSGTRGAIVGLLVGLFLAAAVYIILVKKPVIRRYGLFGIGMFLILASVLFVYRNKLPNQSLIYRIVNLKDSNSEARLIQWKTALTGFKEHKILGVGAENYYIISNTHWDPEMYKYDPSWFDKPHNYPLEVLSTNGVLGFAAYMCLFVFALYGLWRAYKSELLYLGEACALLAGLIAYQAQNIFVFDTVSASLAIYAFLGIIVFTWKESGEEKTTVKIEVKSGLPAQILLGVSFFAMLYLQYASNITSMEAAKRVNFGNAYSVQDAKKASEYFLSALALPYNLDRRETANYYSQFSSTLTSGQDSKLDKTFISEQLDLITNSQRKISENVKNDPILWMRLAIDEMNQATFAGRGIEDSLQSINKAIALAPNRAELLQLRVQYYGYLKDWPNTLVAAKEIARLNPYNPQLRWQLAMTYYLNGREKEAVEEGDKALQDGYKFTNLQQFAWYIQYYQKQNNFEKIVPLLEKAVELEPNELGLYIDLAQAYKGMGDFQHARILAEQVAKSDPSQKATMDAFIKTLK